MEGKITSWVQQILSQPTFEDCFLLEVNFKEPNKVQVFIDSDSGVTFAKCQKISRQLEELIEEDGSLGEKYLLEVSSGGVDRPLDQIRQYPKHIGRVLKVTLNDESTIRGKLKEVLSDQIVLQTKVKEKGKKAKLIDKSINFINIRNSIVQISFK